MRFTTLPDGTSCSVLGFGCGAVMGRVGRADSLRAMQAAFDAGVNVFDTARSYGYGDSEAVLGAFLAGKRGQTLISTKFGVEPGPRQGWKSMLRPVARRVLRVFPQARQAVRRQAAGHIQRIQQASLEPSAMRTSLEVSLRKLQTDYVDFFFLHDVPPETASHDDLFAELGRLREEGKVRRFGVSSSVDAASAILSAQGEVSAVQMPMNLSAWHRAAGVANVARQANRTVLANNIYGGVDGAAGSLRKLQSLSADSALPAEMRDRIAASKNLLAEVLLPLALDRGRAHCAIVSMMSPRNVTANVQAVTQEAWSDEELDLWSEKLTQ